MTRSYILFGRDTLANGTRDRWIGDGGTAGTTPGRVNGRDMAVSVPAFDAFDFLSPFAQDEGGAANRRQLLASLDFASDGNEAFATSFLAAALFQNLAFSGPAGPLNPPVAGDQFGNEYLSFGQFTFALADRDWNRIKNLELFLDDADLAGVSRITLRNFVDVRLKIGDGDAATPPGPEGNPFPRFVSIDIQNAKRGTIDASGSNFNIDLTLSTASNGASFQNSFEITLSALDDLFVLMAGDHAGTTADGLRVRNDGGLSLVRANLGAGNDTYIGFSGNQTVRIEGGKDSGSFAVVTSESPLPGVIPDQTRIDRTLGDLLVAGDARETFVYRAGDGADEILGFNKALDRIAIDRSLQADTQFFQLGGSTLIVFDDLPAGTPGTTEYAAGIFVEGVLLGAADILFIA